MKKFLIFVSSLIPLISACTNENAKYKFIYLAAKYNLTYAAYNETYKLSNEPAYAAQIEGSTDCIKLFDKNETYCVYNVKMIDGLPVGFGSINFSFADKNIRNIYYEFEYKCFYDNVYGGTIYQTEETKIPIISEQICRARYWFIRMTCVIPEIDTKRLVLEFQCTDKYDEPSEFNHKIYF